MTTYLVQMNSVWEDKPASLAKARQLIAGAKPALGSLIVLPEMFATGFSIETNITAEPEQGITEQFLIEIAREHRCAVIGGLVTQDAKSDCRNQSRSLHHARGLRFGPLQQKPALQPWWRKHQQGEPHHEHIIKDCAALLAWAAHTRLRRFTITQGCEKRPASSRPRQT